MTTKKAAEKIGANEEVPTGNGVLANVRQLIAQWFPGVDFEVIATSGPGVFDHFDRLVPSDDGYLRFNLISSYGSGKNRTSYMTSLTYKNFCEGEIGRMLGGLDAAHEMRNLLNRQLHQVDILHNECEREMWKHATKTMLALVKLFGWSPTK